MIKPSEMVFGIPTLQSKKREKYPDTAVLTILAAGDKGTARKIDINTFGVDALELKLDGNDYVNFAFNMENGEKVVYFANTTHIENPSNIRVTKQATFANKKMYDYLAKVFDLDVTKDVELFLTDISAGVGKVVLNNNVVLEETIVLTSDEDDHSNDVIHDVEITSIEENNVSEGLGY